MTTPADKYARDHSSAGLSEAALWLERQTNIRTNFPQMLSGPVQGGLLKMLVQSTGARRVLEIGTFTGYSAMYLAAGLGADGHLDALEINDELEDLILEGWRRAGLQDRMTLHLGDALRTLDTLQGPYDLVYIDANKREYSLYYDLVLPLLRPGGLIVVDDVTQGGKVYADPVPCDAQTQALVAFNDKVNADPRVETVLLPLRDGLMLVRRKDV